MLLMLWIDDVTMFWICKHQCDDVVLLYIINFNLSPKLHNSFAFLLFVNFVHSLFAYRGSNLYLDYIIDFLVFVCTFTDLLIQFKF